MLTRARDNIAWPTVAVLALLALAPLVVTGVSDQSVLVQAMIFAVGAVGLDVLTGYSGQFSFGQFVYFAVGAYTMSALRVHGGVSWEWALLAGVAAAAVLAAVVGSALVRLRFFGSAVGTFFLGAAALDILSGSRLARWTGGSNGLPAPPVSIGSESLSAGHGLYYAVLVGLVVAALTCVRYTRVRAGMAARVVKQNEVVAATLGIRVFREKVRAQMIAGAAAGLGGCLLSLNLGYLSPDTFNVAQSIQLFAIVAVGGTGSIAGPIIGAVFFFTAVNGLSSTSASSSDLFFALVLLAVVIFLNRGLYDLLERGVLRLRALRPGNRSATSQAPTNGPTARPGAEEADELGLAGELIAGAAAPPRRAAPETEVLLQVKDVSVEFGGVHALDGVSVDVRRGEVHAIIGPNGAGKTTFLNCISGLQPSSGSLTLAGDDLAGVPVSKRRQLGIARTFQHPSLVADLDVLDNVKVGAFERQTGSLLLEMFGLPAARRRRRIAQQRAVAALEQLEFPRGRWAVPAGDLTMGEQKHLDIARAIAGEPRLLLLDEPTAGLGAEEVAAVARAIEAVRDAGVTIVVIAHHVGFIRQIADRCTVLNFGQVLTSGRPDTVLADDEVVDIFVGTGVTA